ncbi:hypothetical protein [Sneathiella aquimaris]|uniref:hypothetical protein n=1 Tax=Sneathiella aquimaris TaxID=2599305 RepID=UPI00146B2001|nr:hypothetical protein [Sneathiella aquimaris]
MGKKLGILVIHGIGSQDDEHFADGMIQEIKDHLKGLGKNTDQIAFQPIYWADILIDRQRDYLQRARQQENLNLMAIRHFVVSVLGDAVAYQRRGKKETSTYTAIHSTVRAAVRTLLTDKLGSEEAPLIVMAHSLGGHIMSNYIWDMQELIRNNEPLPVDTDFEQFKTLAGIITFGCNIPLFTFTHQNPQPIDFPPDTLSNDLKSIAKWMNYYDPEDVLAYPLKAISPAYNLDVIEEHEIEVGGFFTSWNPLSHTKYWTDNSFTKPAARYIARFL